MCKLICERELSYVCSLCIVLMNLTRFPLKWHVKWYVSKSFQWTKKSQLTTTLLPYHFSLFCFVSMAIIYGALGWLTQCLSSKHPAVLPNHCSPGMSLAGILDKGIALVHGAAQHTAILGEDTLHVWLLHHSCVEVANKHPGIDGFWICLVGHITGLDLQWHAGEIGQGSGWQMDGWERGNGWIWRE